MTITALPCASPSKTEHSRVFRPDTVSKQKETSLDQTIQSLNLDVERGHQAKGVVNAILQIGPISARPHAIRTSTHTPNKQVLSLDRLAALITQVVRLLTMTRERRDSSRTTKGEYCTYTDSTFLVFLLAFVGVRGVDSRLPHSMSPVNITCATPYTIV